MKGLTFSVKQLFAAVFWIAAGAGCAAFVVRPFVEYPGPAGDTPALVDALARLAALVTCGACIGSGVGALTKHQFWFAVVGALVGPAMLIAARVIF